MNFKNLKKAFHFVLKIGKFWFLFSLITNVFLGIIPAIMLHITKELVNSVAQTIQDPNLSFSIPIFLLLLQLVVALINTTLQNIQNYIDKKFEINLDYQLQFNILQKSATVPLAYFEDHKYYNHLSRIEGSGSNFLTPFKSILQILRTLITFFSMLVFLLSIHWSLVLFSLIVAIPMFIVHAKFGNNRFWMLYNLTPEAREAHYLSGLLKIREAAKEVRAFRLQDYLLNRWSEKFQINNKANLALAKKEHTSFITLDGVSALFYGGAAMIIIWLIQKTTIKIGEFVVVGEAVQTTQYSINSIAMQLANIYEKSLYINDYYDFIDSNIKDSRNEKILSLPTKLVKGIRLENVSFSYPNTENEIIKDVSFNIKPGEKIAIVGENGSGKTTLIKCLTGLYSPTRGRILYDDIDIEYVKYKQLYHKITVIFQDFIKYDFTVKENIGISSPDNMNNKDQIEYSSKLAEAHEFISKFENGYETLLGRFLGEGADLSGGQWQKIAISRAIFKDSEILILDEPTASLDPLTEIDIFKKFHEISKGRTTIFISHRMASTKLADRILVLDKGTVVETGNHEELMSLNGLYADMYTKQTEWNNDDFKKETEGVQV